MKLQVYQLENEYLKIEILNYGAIIKSLIIKSDNTNCVLGFKNNEDYLDNPAYVGVGVVGRCAGRMKNGIVNVDKERYQLERNFLSKHHLHGGSRGLATKFYDVRQIENKLIMMTKMLDKEDDYPGNLELEVIFELKDNCLYQTINGKCDKVSSFNPTNHSYFSFDSTKDILNYQLEGNVDEIIEVDKELIPIQSTSLASTPLKNLFSKKSLKNFYNTDYSQFEYTNFIDHPFRLAKSEIVLHDPDTKHKLKISSNSNYAVVYTGNFLDEVEKPLNNTPNFKYKGLCIEMQEEPNKVHIDNKSLEIKFELE